jgi:hypothetical protein
MHCRELSDLLSAYELSLHRKERCLYRLLFNFCCFLTLSFSPSFSSVPCPFSARQPFASSPAPSHTSEPFPMVSTSGSRTSGLRIIISSRKPGKMPSYHAIVRGVCDDSAPIFLPDGCLGTPMALFHVTCCLAQPRRGDTTEARRARAYQTPTHPFQRTSTVCGPDSKASVCAV